MAISSSGSALSRFLPQWLNWPRCMVKPDTASPGNTHHDVGLLRPADSTIGSRSWHPVIFELSWVILWVWAILKGGAWSFELTTIAWIVICGWMAILAGGGYICGTQIEAVIQLNNPDYVPQRWEGTLLFWAAIVFAVLINTVFGKLLPPIEALMLVIHVLGFFAVLVPLVYVRSVPYISHMTSLLGAGHPLESPHSPIMN